MTLPGNTASPASTAAEAAYEDAMRAVEDAQRLTVLRASRLLDSAAEPAFDRLTRLAVRLLGVPAAFFSLVDETRDFYKSACGFGEPLASARELTGPTFCKYAVQSTVPLVIPDTAADPLYRDVPTVRSLGVAAYVGVPVVVDGQSIGSLCAIDVVPRAWSPAEVEVLAELAASAEREIALRLAAETAQRMAAQLQDQSRLLEQQVEEALSASEEAQALTEELEESSEILRLERGRLADVFAQAPSFLAVLQGSQHVFTLVNEAYFRLVGRRDDVIGRRLADVLPEVRDQGFIDLLDRVLATGEPYVGRELPLTVHDADGSGSVRRYVDFVYLPFVSEQGVRTGIIAHGTDVTASVEARLQIERLLRESEHARLEAQEARRVAEQASRTQAAFLGTMSHEFRTPLNAIGGYAQLLDLEIAGPLNAEQREHLVRLRASNDHMLGLVNDVLDLAKLDADALPMRAEVGRVRNTVGEAIALTVPLAESRAVTIVDGTADASLAYVGDEQRVRQVLVNLLSNAIKFSEPESEVRVTTAESAEAPAGSRAGGRGPFTVIDVRDTGPGIAPEHHAAIFEAFKQVEGGHTRTRDGTGLGLAISRRLSRNMGGDITLDSTPGGGSCFRIWLPATRAPQAGAGSGEGAVPASVRAPGGMPATQALSTIGHRLRDDIEAMLEAWTARLRADGTFPEAHTLSSALLEDHTLVFLANVVQSLVIIDQTGGADSMLMADSGAIQRLTNECHGSQRRQLGWSEAQLSREYLFLVEELTARIRQYASRDPEDVALATGIVTRQLFHARDAALRGYRAAVRASA